MKYLIENLRCGFRLIRFYFCGIFCEEACPTYAIQLTPDFEMSEYDRSQLVYEKEHLLIDGPGKYPDYEMAEYDRNNLVYEKQDLLISGTGKYPGYNFYRVSGMEISGKGKGEAENERPPVDVRSLLP